MKLAFIIFSYLIDFMCPDTHQFFASLFVNPLCDLGLLLTYYNIMREYYNLLTFLIKSLSNDYCHDYFIFLTLRLKHFKIKIHVSKSSK
jgi:hypothetical protein